MCVPTQSYVKLEQVWMWPADEAVCKLRQYCATCYAMQRVSFLVIHPHIINNSTPEWCHGHWREFPCSIPRLFVQTVWTHNMMQESPLASFHLNSTYCGAMSTWHPLISLADSIISNLALSPVIGMCTSILKRTFSSALCKINMHSIVGPARSVRCSVGD